MRRATLPDVTQPDVSSNDNEEVFRPATGRTLAGGVGAVCAFAGVTAIVTDGWRSVLQVWPWLGLVAGAGWALYWRPCVAVSDAGVRIVNVFRTIDVPWPALQDIETKWALTLRTAWGRYRAWAAPAPGRSVMRAGAGAFDRRHPLRLRHAVTEHERRHPLLPANAAARPSDLPTTDSGGAAFVVQQRWKRLRDAGYLDDERFGETIEFARAPVRWHWEMLVGAVLLGGLAALGFLV